MTTSTNKVYLVTGANAGLGLEAVRQLALQNNTKKVFLACRSQEKADKAIELLVSTNDKVQRERLAFAPFDASASKDTISSSITSALHDGEKIDGLIFNAGGVGDDSSGSPGGPNNVLSVFQVNLIGHLHLLEALKTSNYLKENETTIVYSGSEGARGLSSMGIAPPKLPDTVEEYKGMLTGESFEKFDMMVVYAATKAVAALYWAAWARQNPKYHVVTVSPGMTAGTSMASQGGVDRMTRMMMPVLMGIFSWLGLAHRVEDGAKRYVDAVTHSGPLAEVESGAFFASVSGASGRVGDQLEHPDGKQLGDVSKQDAAFQAIQAYV